MANVLNSIKTVKDATSPTKIFYHPHNIKTENEAMLYFYKNRLPYLFELCRVNKISL